MPNFTVGAQKTKQDIQTCFARWGVTDYMISLAKNSMEGEASVSFVQHGGRKTLTCNNYAEFFENLRALYLTLDDLRLAEKRGILDLMGQFFNALPAPTDDPYSILGVTPQTPIDVVDAAYRTLAKAAHPDAGGSDEQFVRLKRAYDSIKEKS